jgi:hypothetical protein
MLIRHQGDGGGNPLTRTREIYGGGLIDDDLVRRSCRIKEVIVG